MKRMMDIMRLVPARHLSRVLLAGLAAAALSACSQVDEGIAPAMKPLSKDAMHLLGTKGMDSQAPIFVRIFKEESELEVWKEREDGFFYHYKTYPICTWSGGLGPKTVQGDKQAPEGFYWVSNGQMNPNSQFHLSFNLGYPNAYDRSYGRTGSALMVHGDCRSAGCYAMTDGLIEEIYALAREAFNGGQRQFAVHAFPFRMTNENLARYKKHEWYRFWKTLKQGYDHFEVTRQVPEVQVCNKSYLVNARFVGDVGRVDPAGPCPQFVRPTVQVFAAKDEITAKLAEVRDMAPGKKTRNLALETTGQTGQMLPGGPVGFMSTIEDVLAGN
jgi:murein L,D-transpeptidase YafK